MAAQLVDVGGGVSISEGTAGGSAQSDWPRQSMSGWKNTGGACLTALSFWAPFGSSQVRQVTGLGKLK